MKKIFLIILGFTAIVGVFAQPNKGRARERVEAQRVGFITQRLNLTPEESQQFWPIYNQYTQQLQEIRKAARLEQPNDDITDVDAEKMIVAQMDRDTRELDLKKEYFQKLKKVISPRKVLKLYRAERDFKTDLLKQLQEVKQMRKELRKEWAIDLEYVTFITCAKF